MAVLNPPDMLLRAAWPGQPMQALAEGATCVYVAWSADWDLLYVGISDDPHRRFREHRYSKAWWPRVHHFEIEEYANRERALQREAELINDLTPICNIIYPRPTP